MGPGRPPKPTELKAAQGTLRQHRERGKAPDLPAMEAVPPAPPALSARGQQLWMHYAGILVKRRLLAFDGGDLMALEMMCREWDRYLDLLDTVYGGPEPEGASIPKPDGGVMRNPNDVALNAAFKNAIRLMAEFHLSPMARLKARSAMAPAPDPDDPYAEFRAAALRPINGGKKT